MKELIAKINSFDTYYEMSDSFRTIDNGSHQKFLIKNELNGLSKKQLTEIEKGLNKNGLFNWKRYFI